MNEHLQLEDLDLYALGALDADERREVELHLKDCPHCAQRLTEARSQFAAVALTAPPQAPPPSVKQQLMARIQAESPKKTPVAPKKKTASGWKLATAWSIAAVCAAVAIFFAVTSYRLNGTVQDYRAEQASQRAAVTRANAILDLLNAKNTVGVTLTALPQKPQPTGRVLYHPQYGLIFYAQNLPAAPENRTYQLWLVPTEGKPISAGIFAPDTKGVASIVLPPLPKGVTAKAFAVTVEPQGGVPQPTGPKVLIGTA